jgi:hypothetical protein
MADALILEFEGVGREDFETVNRILGIDRALQEGGVAAPSRVEWLELAGYTTPGS